MDKAAILAEVLRRNALRKAARLPLLDVDFEFRFAVAEADYDEYRALSQQPEHAAVRDRIRGEVVAEFQRRFGPNFGDGNGFGGRWVVPRETNKRFRNYMAGVMGRDPPRLPVQGPSIVYGGG